MIVFWILLGLAAIVVADGLRIYLLAAARKKLGE